MTDRNDWLIWQLVDSAFPTGSFAHSGGIEAAWQCGQIRNGHDLSAFVEAALTQIAYGALPFMLAAYDEPALFAELNRYNEAFLTNHVANRASRLQGQALTSAVDRIFTGSPDLQEVIEACRSSDDCHYAPAFGILHRALYIDRATTCRLFLFIALRGLISAAVRLGIVGPMEGQRLQSHTTPFLETLVLDRENPSLENVAQTAPILDICHGMQDRLYSRLFQT